MEGPDKNPFGVSVNGVKVFVLHFIKWWSAEAGGAFVISDSVQRAGGFSTPGVQAMQGHAADVVCLATLVWRR